MNKNVIVALIAGVLGGLATRYIAPAVAFAQNQPAVAKEVRAQSFTIVDSSDRKLGTFSAEPIGRRAVIRSPGQPNQLIQPLPLIPSEVRIVLRDADGREMWSSGSDVEIRPLSQR